MCPYFSRWHSLLCLGDCCAFWGCAGRAGGIVRGLSCDYTSGWLQSAFCKGAAAVLPSSKFSCIFVIPSHHRGVAVAVEVGKEFGCVPVEGRALLVPHLPKPARSLHQQDNPAQNPAGSTSCHGLICSCRYFGKKEWIRQGTNTTNPGGGKCLCSGQ